MSSLPTFLGRPISAAFTSQLEPDPAFPTPEVSHGALRSHLGPRLVRDAHFTYIRPEPLEASRLLMVSDPALAQLGLSCWSDQSQSARQKLADLVSGRSIPGWLPEPGTPDEAGKSAYPYPWAQCYGGYQFGVWAGQLGDGRAISLFDILGSDPTTRFEIQLKGAGKTPYSRFADGRAVLRSSIREFVASEYLDAIGIPTTRALAIVASNKDRVRREQSEPGAIVCRFAPSWLRFGTFDLPFRRGERHSVRRLADFVIASLPAGWDDPEKLEESVRSQNRYFRLLCHIATLNARTVALWQSYGFINGVLNTDNTSIFGLSLDFGPFAFIDAFDPAFTPNHDDIESRYSYQNQPSVILWNIVRLTQALTHLIAAGDEVDAPAFVSAETAGRDGNNSPPEKALKEEILMAVVGTYDREFNSRFREVMARRLGFAAECSPSCGKPFRPIPEQYMVPFLDNMFRCLRTHRLDFSHWFRRLSSVRVSDLATSSDRLAAASLFLPSSAHADPPMDTLEMIADFLDRWKTEILAQWGPDRADTDRIMQMKKVNPNFVPRAWVLDELIQQLTDEVKQTGAADDLALSPTLSRFMQMVHNPFNDAWENGPDPAEQVRLCGDVPRNLTGLQCSCSS